MADGAICKRCRSGIIQNNKCTHCGYRPEKTVANALKAGTRLGGGRFVINKVLGGGGYGITYEATDYKYQNKVALKEFFPQFALQRSANGLTLGAVSPQSVEVANHAQMRFAEEAALLHKLRNVEEIVNVYHSFEENHTAYYTMELLPGEDMQSHLRNYGKMTWSEARPIMIQILRALYATHQIGYIHRDISPDNIFLMQNGKARLIDFGNARQYQMNAQLTAVVKEKFAPPEQFSISGNQGPWTDVYSLCTTFYYAMTGILPLKSTERLKQNNSLQPLSMLVGDVPEYVSAAFQVGLNPDEKKRYQTIEDMAFALFPNQVILGDLVKPQNNIQNVQNVFEYKAPRKSGSWEEIAAFAQKMMQTLPVMFHMPKKQFPPKYPLIRYSLVGIRGHYANQTFLLGNEENISMGRTSEKRISYAGLKAPNVSRNQCTLIVQDGIAYIRDDGSTWGTYINERKLPSDQWHRLNPGDLIGFAQEVFLFQEGGGNSK